MMDIEIKELADDGAQSETVRGCLEPQAHQLRRRT